MEAKLYVGNLPYTTVDADLENLFAQAGTVKSAQVIRDRASGRSKGFGFVEMSTSEEAQSAITMFHGKDFSGRPLTVNLARPREERPGGGGGGGFRSGGGRRPGGGGGDRERRRDY
jgi:RNA recognition motif-containing protein